ncbi:hypothetical protein GCM10011497_19530 [Elstera cyanobacteriorum]|nr:hypothetical protein GCM10011497_19530 [Elstera cyanobacteriorum]
MGNNATVAVREDHNRDRPQPRVKRPLAGAIKAIAVDQGESRTKLLIMAQISTSSVTWTGARCGLQPPSLVVSNKRGENDFALQEGNAHPPKHRLISCIGDENVAVIDAARPKLVADDPYRIETRCLVPAFDGAD